MSDALEIIRVFVRDRLDVEPSRVTAAATLSELEIDSMMLLELMFEFEDRLGFKPDKNLPTPKTIGQLLEIVGGLRTATVE